MCYDKQINIILVIMYVEYIVIYTYIVLYISILTLILYSLGFLQEPNEE